jgi:hypothetical protein
VFFTPAMSSWDILRRMGFSRKNKRSSTQMNSLGSANGLPSSCISSTAERQTVLLLHAPKQPYQVTEGYRIPRIRHDREILVKCHAIGLNPIDWKAPYAYSSLICISSLTTATAISTLAFQNCLTYPAENLSARLLSYPIYQVVYKLETRYQMFSCRSLLTLTGFRSLS